MCSMGEIIIATDFSDKNASFAILEFENDAWWVSSVYLCK